MTLFSVYGRLMTRSVNRYRLKWDAPCRSKFQFKVKQMLKPIWEFDILFEEFPVFGTKLKVDILNMTKRIAIEVNGPQHDKLNKFFHDNSRLKFLAGIKRDMTKYQWLERNGIKLVEYVEKDLLDLKSFYARLSA